MHMNKKALCVLAACFAATALGSPAFADDANSARPNIPPKQMMNDCMAKERQENPGASEDDMKKTCHAKIDSYNKHPSETKSPPNNP
jgi:pentapeptide MXKDX repeat protein